jgi:hypothetical protein
MSQNKQVTAGSKLFSNRLYIFHFVPTYRIVCCSVINRNYFFLSVWALSLFISAIIKTTKKSTNADLIMLHFKFQKYFVVNALFSQINTQTMHIKSITHNSIAMCSLKIFIPLRNSNPGLLFLRRMRCPLHHTGLHFTFSCCLHIWARLVTLDLKVPNCAILYNGERYQRPMLLF